MLTCELGRAQTVDDCIRGKAGAAAPNNALANITPFLGGHANAFAVKAAAVVANTVGSTIAKLQKQGYTVQVVGHGVGGAVAAIATMQMIHDLPKLAKGVRRLSLLN